jgi:hypothetical protein
MIDYVLDGIAILLSLGSVFFAIRAHRRYRRAVQMHVRLCEGCCTSCGGSGGAYDESTGGRCWDCQGSGHPHLGACGPPEVRS